MSAVRGAVLVSAAAAIVCNHAAVAKPRPKSQMTRNVAFFSVVAALGLLVLLCIHDVLEVTLVDESQIEAKWRDLTAALLAIEVAAGVVLAVVLRKTATWSELCPCLGDGEPRKKPSQAILPTGERDPAGPFFFQCLGA